MLCVSAEGAGQVAAACQGAVLALGSVGLLGGRVNGRWGNSGVASPRIYRVTGPSPYWVVVAAGQAAAGVHVCGHTSTGLTPGDPRVVITTKGSCPQTAKGVAVRGTACGFASPSGLGPRQGV